VLHNSRHPGRRVVSQSTARGTELRSTA
jgi:hypothetical protein